MTETQKISYRIPLFFAASMAFSLTLFSSALIPSVKLFACSTLFALIYIRKPLIVSLWLSAICGFFLDLISTELSWGFHALSCTLCTLVLHRQRHHFFHDKILSLGLLTFLISLTYALIQWLLLLLLSSPPSFHMSLVCTDLALMPLADAACAYLCFCAPVILYYWLKKKKWFKHLIPWKRQIDESH